MRRAVLSRVQVDRMVPSSSPIEELAECSASRDDVDFSQASYRVEPLAAELRLELLSVFAKSYRLPLFCSGNQWPGEQ